jgi:flagellar protein FliO/FliZ
MYSTKLTTFVVAALLPLFAQGQTREAAADVLGPTLAASSLRMLGSLAIVLVLLGGCAWLLRHFRDRQNGAAGAIEIVSGVSLGAKERVVLLRVGDEQVLVGVSPAGMRCLHVVHGRPVPPRFDLSMGAEQ